MLDKYLSKRAQGLMIMGIGIILFLNTTGFIDRGLNSLVFLSSLGLMVYGFVQARGPEFFKSLIDKVEKR